MELALGGQHEPGPSTLTARLEKRVARSPVAVAYLQRTDGGDWQSITWKQVLERVERLAANLVQLGLAPGDRVAFLLPTGPDWEYCHHAVLAARGVVVGLDAHDAPENLRHILERTAPTLLIVGDVEKLEQLRKAAPLPRQVVLAAGTCPEGVLALADLLETPAQPLDFRPQPGDLATIIFTSGSTGRPNGVAYSHQQLAMACDAARRQLDLPADDNYFSPSHCSA